MATLTEQQPQDWLIRVGDGDNFISSIPHQRWGMKTTNSLGKKFIRNVKSGDRLWFITSKSGGSVMCVGIYSSHNSRINGPHVYSMTDEELGWRSTSPQTSDDDESENTSEWDTEIYYNHLEWICELDDKGNYSGKALKTNLKTMCQVIQYQPHLCGIDLPNEYYSYFEKLSEKYQYVPLLV